MQVSQQDKENNVFVTQVRSKYSNWWHEWFLGEAGVAQLGQRRKTEALIP
jgi:hypothetical protein